MGLKECEKTFKEHGFCLCLNSLEYGTIHAKEIDESIKHLTKNK